MKSIFQSPESAALGLALNLTSKTVCGGVSTSKILKVAQFSTKVSNQNMILVKHKEMTICQGSSVRKRKFMLEYKSTRKR